MKYSRGRRRSQFSQRRKKRNFLPLITFIVLITVFVFSTKALFSAIFSSGKSENTSATIQILKGNAEFATNDNPSFSTTFTGQTFFTGDIIRTTNKSHASLEFPDGTFVFLGEKTELKILELEKKSSDKKTFQLQLISGNLWTRAADGSFDPNTNSTFEIETPRSRIHVLSSVFDISSHEAQDVLRLIKGNVEVEIFDGEETLEVNVGVGQKLVINQENINNIKNNIDVLEIVDNDFIKSEWHLKNLEQFFQTEATEIRRQIEIDTQQQEAQRRAAELVAGGNEDNLETSDEIESPKFLSPKEGERIPAETESIQVEGIAPENAVQIVVNDYTLTRFEPGDRKWSYFAAKRFGTLVAGENLFSVVAVSREGKKSNAAVLKVFYDGTSTITTTDTEANTTDSPTPAPTANINNFVAPEIVNPLVSDPETPYQTSAAVVTLRGRVDAKTNSVIVTNLSIDPNNHFKLARFKAGDTEFAYIANANYGNMKEGENIFAIQAIGPDGKSATTNIKIFYTPLEVGN